MKKILVNRKPLYNASWGGGNNFLKAFYEHASKYDFEIVNQFEMNLDAIFIMDPRYDELGISIKEIHSYKQHRPKTKIIHRVNECDARKNTNDMDPMLRWCSLISDVSIFISNWLKDYHNEKGWNCKKQKTIYGGVDKSIFKPNEKFKDGLTHLVCHHWSSNEMKNKFTKQLDEWLGTKDGEDFTFTYIGRAPEGLKNTKIISPLHGKELGEELGRYDICVNSSLYDPFSNSLLEAFSCGLPTFVYKDGGGCVEAVNMVGQGFVYESFEHLIELLQMNKIIEDSFPPQLFDWKISWEECIRNYFDVINEETR